MNKIDFDSLVLGKGSHASPDKGMCVMEAVAYFNNEPHSDSPACACPVLTKYMIRINDFMKEKERQVLKPYILRLIGTRDDNSKKRMEILVTEAIVTITPYALRLAGLEEHANKLENLTPSNGWLKARQVCKDAAYAAAAYAADAAADNAADAYADAAASYAADADAAASYAAAAASYAADAADADAYAADAAAAANAAANAADAAAANATHRKIYINMALNALDKALEVK